MKSKKLRILRQQASLKQNHRCYYCHFPMWDSDCEYFSLIHKIPLRLARYLNVQLNIWLPVRMAGGTMLAILLLLVFGAIKCVIIIENTRHQMRQLIVVVCHN